NHPSTDSSAERCLNCGRSEADAPISVWRFQGRALHICSECLPVLIHERGKLMATWEARAAAAKAASAQGDEHA
ncbi:MAG: hypothetical protein IT323_17285, partial [Anaerolineae bacterium]|nr:hypothetical protein [Anaerolineae bacterium]